ncbi:hypothetical protein [Bacillus massiliigorillae]|uniref:YqgU-like beta propeller domain-containing protein n=1 Tax=Bacillus massiliigorillae TaxID=1243664 RepID=UPI000399C85B|nr:hypothetical protein [Bacillus massiliigorillae]
MVDRRSWKGRRRFVFFVCYCFLILFIVGCENQPKKTTKQIEEKKPGEVTIESLSLSDEYTFESSYGWLDNDTIIYSANKDDEHYLFSYHIPSKEKKELFKTGEMIAEASVSPNKKYILVYSTSDSSVANVHFLTSSGSKQYSVSIPSSELSFDWNTFAEDTVLIDSFYEDWTYKTYVCNFEKKTLHEVKIPQPFAQWHSKDSVLFLQWDDDSPRLSAPLMKYNLESNKESDLYKDVITFKANKKVLLTVHEIPEDKNNVVYMFHDWEGKELQTIKMPVISSYSDWMIPSFDINDKQHSLITFQPYEAALMDQYDQKFQLSLYNWKTGEKRVIGDHLESAPLLFSPAGDKCLYGNKLEQIIVLN